MLDRNFDHLVKSIYAGACDDQAFMAALELLAAHHECPSAVFIYTDRALPYTDIVMTCGPFSRPEIQARYFADYARDDPAPQVMARLPVGEAGATDRLFTPEYRARSRILHDFFRPLGIEEALGGPVINSESRTGIVAVHRGSDRPPFDDDEIAAFGRLLPHFGQALRLRRTYFAAEDARVTLAAALDASSQAVVIVGPQACVVHANAHARALFARNDGLTLTRAGRMKLGDEEADSQLRHALDTSRKPLIVRARRLSGAYPFVIRVNPVSTFAAPAQRDGAVLSIFDPDHRPPDIPGTLRAAFGVSQEAAALLAMLVSGEDLAAYASSARVSRHTARFHLRALFAATGTSRQADLTALATALVRDLGEPVRPTLRSAAVKPPHGMRHGLPAK